MAQSAQLEGDEVLMHVWIQVIALTATFCLLFWPSLVRLWGKTNPFTGEDNWKHGVFVPLIGLFYLYVNREHLHPRYAKTAWSGLPIMLFGVLFYFYGIWPGQNDWFKDVGMVITLFGMVTFLAGWRIMQTAWFPIVFLISALPWPGLFYSMIAGPLQKLAAWVAVRILVFLSVDAGSFGTKIFVVGKYDHVIRTLNVEEACAGLRSLMTFIAVAGGVAFLSFRPLWQKLVMVASAVPIAIFCNTMRITVQGILDGFGRHQWSEGFAHGFLGLAMMIPAFFLILLVGWIVQNLFIDEVEVKRAVLAGSPNRTTPAVRPAAISRAASIPFARLDPAAARRTPATRPADATTAPASGAQRVSAPAAPMAKRPAPAPPASAQAATVQAAGAQSASSQPASTPLSGVQARAGQASGAPPRTAQPKAGAAGAGPVRNGAAAGGPVKHAAPSAGAPAKGSPVKPTGPAVKGREPSPEAAPAAPDAGRLPPPASGRSPSSPANPGPTSEKRP